MGNVEKDFTTETIKLKIWAGNCKRYVSLAVIPVCFSDSYLRLIINLIYLKIKIRYKDFKTLGLFKIFKFDFLGIGFFVLNMYPAKIIIIYIGAIRRGWSLWHPHTEQKRVYNYLRV